MRAWVEYYLALGVTSFHLFVHGPPEENRETLALPQRYPVSIRDVFGGPFLEGERRDRFTSVLRELAGRWVFVVDSDEFVELPYPTLAGTIRALERFGATAMPAPLLQRVAPGGSLDSPAVVGDPFRQFPLASVDLYRLMGTKAALSKYPLAKALPTSVGVPGNHHPINGPASADSPVLGISHHFKWRRSVLERLRRMIADKHPYRHESEAYLAHLIAHDLRVPLDDAFTYSRAEGFRRGLLRHASWRALASCRLRRSADRLPGPLRAAVKAVYQALPSRGRR